MQCVADNKVNELVRGIRHQMTNLIEGLEESQLRAMQLGLGHTLSRYKLKFSPDKVDTMIVQVSNVPLSHLNFSDSYSSVFLNRQLDSLMNLTRKSTLMLCV